MAGAVAFAAAIVLSSTFNWPGILREPASVVLPAFAGGGTSLVRTWFATCGCRKHHPPRWELSRQEFATFWSRSGPGLVYPRGSCLLRHDGRL